MGFKPSDSLDPEDMGSMGIVDAALHSKGHPFAFTLSLATVLFFAVFYVWADHAMIEDLIRGSGRVIPAESVRDIQSEKGGTIQQIYVQEGARVKPNDIVAVIANVQDVSALQDLINRRGELETALVRLNAEASGVALQFSQEMEDTYPAAVQSQRQLYVANKQLYEGEDKQLISQIEQRLKEVEIAEAQKIKLEKALETLQAKEAEFKPRVGKSVSAFAYQELQENIITAEGELTSVIQGISHSQSAARAAQERLNTKRAERQNKIAEQQAAFRQELDITMRRIETGTDVVGQAELRSPVEGVVKEIMLPANSVARPAQVIMQIIPTSDTLEIEAKFRPADRGFLHIGQIGIAKFSNFDFSIYGGLEVEVTRISEDTIEDKRGDSWYEVRLVTKRSSLVYQGEELPLFPGLTVSVDLPSNKRSIINYLMDPVLSAFETAFSER